MKPYVLAIVGHSGAGKTTLIERLLPVLTAQGLRVATMKHSHHEIDLDDAGKDSWRHKQAGAKANLLLTPSGLRLVADVTDACDPSQLAQHYFADMDLVLAEGFSRAVCPKIEVLRAACALAPRCTVADGLIAMASDVGIQHLQLVQFSLDDSNAIAEFIAEKILDDEG